MPDEGIMKPPADPSNPRVGQGLKKAGENVGIDFTGKCDRVPNTVQAHALLDYAKSLGLEIQDKLSEALFQSYFTDGITPMGDALVTIGENVGISADVTKSVISDAGRLQAARQSAQQWSQQGVSGVPFFVMNGKSMFSGAQEESVIVSAAQMVADRFPLQQQPSPSSM